MLALAVVLLLIVGLLVIVSFAGSGDEIVIEFLNVTVTTSVGGVFVTGVVCGLIALASVLALLRSWRNHQARAEEVRELRRLAGVPDPDETDSTGAESDATPKETTEPADSSDDEDDRDKVGGTARADIAAASRDSHDTAPVPDSEDPPRT